jgi:hypothetical protein
MNLGRRAAWTTVAGATLLLLGCHDVGGAKASFLMNEADFQAVNSKVFPSPKFTQSGSGRTGGSEAIEFEAEFTLTDSRDAVEFDFGAWRAHLGAKETFQSTGERTTQGVCWRHTWTNDRRHIRVDTAVLRDGRILTTYSEVLR